MQVVNRKERKYSMWRFAGLYILSVALPVLLIVNSMSMKEVETVENEHLLQQLKKRDEALAQLSQLATTLKKIQELKPPYAREATNKEEYDKLRFKFEREVENLKRLYYNDTTVYKTNYYLADFLESNQKEYEKTGVEFVTQLDQAIINERAKQPSVTNVNNDASRLQTELQVTQTRLQAAQTQINDLRLQIERLGRPAVQVQQLREKAIQVESNIDQIIGRLDEIEVECNGIQRKGDRNIDIKNRVLTQVQFLKNQAASAKNTNSSIIR
jgi:hypothetical protein